MATIEVRDDTFQSLVLRADKPVLIDFWATWCAPCKQVAPILEELSDELAEHLIIAKLDVDQSPVISGQLGIKSIPTLVLFQQGQPVAALAGAQPKDKLLDFLEQNVPGLRPPTIAAQELAQLLERGAPITVIDVRAQNDFSRSHLRRAICVQPEQLPEVLAKLSPQQLVVLVCRTGEQSTALAVQIASAAGGLHQVVALQKGLLDWEGDQLPTYSDREEARLDKSA